MRFDLCVIGGCGHVGRVDHGCSGDPNNGGDVGAPLIGRRHRSNSIGRIDEAGLPERGPRIVHVKRVHAVVFRRDVNDVVTSLVGDIHIWHV